ncbi:MAG: helix-turn-helix domain-containing protein [Bacteroidaceae bacterium]|nr:helix-turn-helix domain-containing protein [Bacteroidaceae bacterium]
MKKLLSALIGLWFAVAATAQQSFFYGANLLGSSLITTISQTSDGLLWVGTERGLCRFDGYHFTPIAAPENSLLQSPPDVSALYPDSVGRLWVGTARGLFLHDRGTDRLVPVCFPDRLEPRVVTVRLQPDGLLLAGTSGYGSFIVDPATMTAQPQTGYIPEGNQAFVSGWEPSAKLRALAPEGIPLTCSVRDAAGNEYVGTRGDGIYWVPAGATTMQRLALTVAGFDLNRARVQALFIDRQGNLWAGCQQKGLLMVPLQRPPLFTTWSFLEQHLETGTGVSAIVPADEGASQVAIWCAVQGDGIYGFSPEGHIVAHPSAPAGAETLARDGDGNYWLGANYGLWSYEPSTGAARRMASFTSERVNIIRQMPDGRLAVSAFGDGLYIINRSTGAVEEHLTMHATDTLGRGRLSNDWIYCLDIDGDGRIWMGTSSGVCCYDPARRSFANHGWRVLAPAEHCRALHVLASGDVLLARERGLWRWSPRQDFQEEAGTEPLHGKSVSYIAEDAQGTLWLSTDEGVWSWSPEEQKLVAYVGVFGLREREFVQGAGLQLADGRILFGTADGVTLFSPDSLSNIRTSDAPVQLTAFVLGGQAVNTLTLSNGRAVIDAPLADAHRFSLSYVDAAFRLEFSLLDFATAGGVSFEYRMQGDDRWHQTAKGENTITFSHLPPGTYNLEVRALSAGTYTPTQTYVIEVRPPWWKTTLAYWIYALIFVAGIAACAYAYQRHVQHQVNREKLHFLMSAINTQDTPLTLDDMKRAISSFVQSRKHQRNLYGNSAAVVDRLDTPEVRGNDEALMERIVQSVNRHLGDSEFSVEQLCSEAGISRAHLHRKMKEMTGMPITEFIRNIRLEQAARLLRERKLNITQVAYTVGFSNQGYFSTVFHKHFGVSPRDYVEQQGK